MHCGKNILKRFCCKTDSRGGGQTWYSTALPLLKQLSDAVTATVMLFLRHFFYCNNWSSFCFYGNIECCFCFYGNIECCFYYNIECCFYSNIECCFYNNIQCCFYSNIQCCFYSNIECCLYCNIECCFYSNFWMLTQQHLSDVYTAIIYFCSGSNRVLLL